MDYRNSSMFSSAVEKYGLEKFTYEVLELCDSDQLDEREVYWISYYGTFPPSRGYGYNLTSGGGHYEVSDETREKLSECRKGDKNWNSSHRGELHPLYGKKISEEHKRKISEAKKNGSHPTRGKHLPSEWVENLRLGMIGTHNTLGKKSKSASSKFHGVRLNKNKRVSDNWIAYTKWESRGIHIGTYPTEVDAAKAYDAYVREYNLPHPLNFPD